MHYGIVVVPFGIYADPKNVVQLGQAADSAGQVITIWEHRSNLKTPYEIAIMGQAYSKDKSMITDYEAAGGTWWLEILAPLLGSHEDMLRRVHAGPPLS